MDVSLFLSPSHLHPGTFVALAGAAAVAAGWHVRSRRAQSFPWDRAGYARRGRRDRLRSYRVQLEAEHRAEALLRGVIGQVAFEQMQRRGFLEVRSPAFPNRVYLVPERQGPVTVCEHGRPLMRLCVQTVERVPDHDTVVMHKLMIEGNEREYLRIANRV